MSRRACIPAFRINKWRKGSAAKLPAPTRSFGLAFSRLDEAEKALGELAGFRHLARLDLSESALTWDHLSDAGRQALAKLEGLTSLAQPHVMPEDLEVLARLPRLVELDASHSCLLDEELGGLAGLKSLRVLSLRSSPQISGEGMDHLARLHGLRSLDLSYTGVDNQGLKKLAGLGSLRVLRLEHTRVDDEGLASLASLKHLTHLDLSDTRVSEKGLRHLAGLSSLTHLDLLGTMVTGAGAASLPDLPRLRVLRLRGAYGEDLLALLQKRFPGCRIRTY